jgi:hypothetical protein
MTRPFIRRDMLPLAKELGVAPCAAQRMVEIDRDSFEQCQALAKRSHTSVKVIINSALHAWLGMR